MNIKHVGIGIIAIAVIITVVVLAVYFIVESEWSTPWNENVDVTGIWGEEIIITYSDGTTDSLKLLLINRDRPWPLYVQYMGQDIVCITYNINAMSTGTEYTTCNVVRSSFAIHKTVSGNVYDETISYTGSMYLTVNGGQETLCSASVFIEDRLAGYPSGEYTVSFTPMGSITYRGENAATSEWYTATLPSGCTIVVDNIAGTITLDLTSTYTWY